MRTRWIHGALVVLLTFASGTMACRPELGAEGLSDPLVGTEAPPFSLANLEGSGRVALSGQRGKVVLLDFWAIFCGPCRESMPHVQAFDQRFPDEDFHVLSINLDPNEPGREDEVRAFMQRYGYGFDVLIDNGRVGNLYGAARIPRVVLIDRAGQVRRVFQGRTHPALVQQAIELLIAEPATAASGT